MEQNVFPIVSVVKNLDFFVNWKTNFFKHAEFVDVTKIIYGKKENVYTKVELTNEYWIIEHLEIS